MTFQSIKVTASAKYDYRLLLFFTKNFSTIDRDMP